MAMSSILKRLAGLFLLAALALSTGCNSRGVGPTTEKYHVSGAMVVDLDRDSTFIAVRVQRNDSIFTSATVRVNNRALAYADLSLGLDSVYTFVTDTVQSYLNAAIPFIVQDADSFADTTLIQSADSFSIQITNPALRLLQPIGNVQVEWTGAAGSGGYILAAVHRDSAYIGWGYSILAASVQANAGTIPSAAFVLTDGLNPDTGWYHVFVYAMTGSPDSAISSALLPAPMPNQFVDNIAKKELGGNFGVLIVSRRDSVRSAVQP
jgi:hypothetical protein